MAHEQAEHGGLAATVGDLISHVIPGRQTVRGFEEDAAHYGPLNRRPLGLRSVPLDRIVGSVGRARELGPDFLPHGGHWEEKPHGRFNRILRAFERGEILPPVELYKLGYNYYVLDGNHRVAAMKKITRNDGEIDAHVTQFLPAGDTDAARVYLERRAFEERTGLTHVGAVERDHYGMLLDEIENFQAELSSQTGEDVPLKRAASDWHAVIWLPRADQIRRSRLRQRWPEKRTADIYCYIKEHQAEESKRQGRPLSWEEALDSFRARHGATRRRETGAFRLPRLALPFRRGQPPRRLLTAPEKDLDVE